MRITINPRLDMETLTWVSNDGVYEYAGQIFLYKGDSVAKQAEQQQMQFSAQLMQLFNSQYATQKSQLDYLNSRMRPIIDAGGTGLSSQELASQRTAATDENATAYQHAQAALNNQINQQAGGSKLASVAGTTGQADAALLNAEAGQEASSQEAITAQNAQLRQTNYWNSINALNGVAAQENPLGYANTAVSGGNAVSGLSQAVTASKQSQLLGALGGVAGGVGAALGGGFSKGGLFNGCWIAASFYGWADRRTKMLRLWLNAIAPTWFRVLYLAHGEWISKTPIRWAFRPVFEYVLSEVA